MRQIKLILASALALLLANTPASFASEDDWVLSGTIEISSTQIALIGSGSGGSGTLEFGGEEHEFSITGLGVGGIGIKTINAVGAVYNLDDISQFAGTYTQARAGATLGEGSGAMRLGNSNGVILDLKFSSSGLGLSLGVDGMVIKLK